MNYILEINLSFAALYLVYRYLLRDLTFYSMNRIVLILIPALSITLPLLTWETGGNAIASYVLPVVDLQSGLDAGTASSSYDWVSMAYLLVSVLFLSFFVYKLYIPVIFSEL